MENNELHWNPKGDLVPLRDEGELRVATAQWCELRVLWRGCQLGTASTQSRGIPRESGLSGSATRFSPYSVHFGARDSRRRDSDAYRLARSLLQQVWQVSRPTEFKEQREILSDEESGCDLSLYTPSRDSWRKRVERERQERFRKESKWVSRTPSITRPARRRTITLCYPATSLPRWDLARQSEFFIAPYKLKSVCSRYGLIAEWLR